MSLIGQLSPNYGNADTVGVLRDIDLVIGMGAESEKFAPIFNGTRDKVVSLLSDHPKLGASVRNQFFRSKDDIVDKEVLSDQNKERMIGVDMIHWEYERLMFLRQRFEQNPESTLQDLIDIIEKKLKDFPINKNGIMSLSQEILDASELNFTQKISDIQTKLGHIGVISFCEGCITEGKCLERIDTFAKNEREHFIHDKNNSMEYWNFTNIINLGLTRKKISDLPEESSVSRSFVLSGGAGNAFTQLAVIQKFVEEGGKIQSISGTSMGAAVGILVGSIGNDAKKIRELMDDLIIANDTGEMPLNLLKNESRMIAVFERLREKYGINHGAKFSDLSIPVVVNAGRQYKGGEQEIALGGNEDMVSSVLASMNVPFPHKNDNSGALGYTPIHGVNLIDYAANERGNPTHWIELLGQKQENIIDIDVGYSSENGGSPLVRRLFQRATIRDFFAKQRIANAGGVVIDMPLDSKDGYNFPKGTVQKFFDIGNEMYEYSF